MIARTFTAVVHQEDDLYVAECPEVGSVSQGRTAEDAVANLKEATELYLEEFGATHFSHPFVTTLTTAHPPQATRQCEDLRHTAPPDRHSTLRTPRRPETVGCHSWSVS